MKRQGRIYAQSQSDLYTGLLESGVGVGGEPTNRLRDHSTRATLEAFFLASLLEIHKVSRIKAQAAQKVIDRHGSLAAVLRTPSHELSELNFIDATGAANVRAVQQLMLQCAYEPLRNVPLFKNLDYLIRYLSLKMGRERHEQVRLLSLDIKSQLKNDNKLAEGTDAFVHIDVKTVICQAAKDMATSIVLVHNHPSGDANPSPQDVEFTTRIERACEIIDIYLADHIIVAGPRWFSFKLNNLIGNATRRELS